MKLFLKVVTAGKTSDLYICETFLVIMKFAPILYISNVCLQALLSFNETLILFSIHFKKKHYCYISPHLVLIYISLSPSVSLSLFPRPLKYN